MSLPMAGSLRRHRNVLPNMTPQTWCQRVKPVSLRDRIPSPPAPHFLKLLEQWQHCCAGPPGERQSSRVLGRLNTEGRIDGCCY